MEIKYQNRIVAFVDVLGFKNLIYSGSLKDLNTYYQFIITNFKQAVLSKAIGFLLISDSIVIYTKNSQESLKGIINLIAHMQAKLLERGIILRGAISKGDLYVNKLNNVIVGSGLINAFQLESKSKYPRVIIDRKLLKEFYQFDHEIIQDNIRLNLPLVSYESFGIDLEDFPYVNYGSILAARTNNFSKNYIINYIKRNLGENDNVEKYQWLRQHLKYSAVDVLNILKAKEKLYPHEKTSLKRCQKIIEYLDKI